MKRDKRELQDDATHRHVRPEYLWADRPYIINVALRDKVDALRGHTSGRCCRVDVYVNCEQSTMTVMSIVPGYLVVIQFQMLEWTWVKRLNGNGSQPEFSDLSQTRLAFPTTLLVIHAKTVR